MAKGCVYFCTDRGYLFTTLLSAMQARAQVDREVADVYIVGVNLDPESLRTLERICAAEQISTVHADDRSFEGLPGMFGRFFFHRMVPHRYESYFYVDGDVQFTGSLNELFAIELPAGRLMAVADPMAFMARERTKQAEKFREYLGRIGMPENRYDRYFNSGAVYASGESWAEVCEQSLEYVRQGRHLGIWPDQSALNAVAQDRFLPLSLRWNFPIYMMNCGVYEAVGPRILHFMSNPKPWHGTFPPWNRALSRPYLQLLARYPELAAYVPAFGLGKRVKYHLQQRYKRVTETVSWKYSPRRKVILAYEEACAEALRMLENDRVRGTAQETAR